MPRNNEQKEANDSEIISDREIWSAIRRSKIKSQGLRHRGDHRRGGDNLHRLYGGHVVSLSRILGSENSERRRSRRAFPDSERTQEN